jgi:hypothetical protein
MSCFITRVFISNAINPRDQNASCTPIYVPSAMHWPIQESQLCGLAVLSSLAAGCDSVSAQLLSPDMLQRLQGLIRNGMET